MSDKIKLFTDSAADLPQIYRDKYDVSIVPLSIVFGNEEFKDQVNLTMEEFWERLLNVEELPSTSQVNPHEFVEAFKPYIEQGYTILYVGISSSLSGTLQSAIMAKEVLNTDKIHIFDSKSASIGESLLVIHAAEMLERGHSLDEVWAALEKNREESFAKFVVESLTHLVKGGRLSKAQSLLGTMLSIKPILRVTPEGTIEAEDKVRSTKKALQTIVAKAKEQRLDFSDTRIAIVHSYGAEQVNELKELVERELAPKEIVIGLIGPTIGTHAGPGGIALFF